MDIRILNKDFQWEYTIDSYKSFIWTERYQDYGDFEIYLPMQEGLLDKLQLDYYVEIDGSEYTMIIETLQIVTDPDSGDMLIVSGRDLTSILDRRVILRNANAINNTVLYITNTYLKECFETGLSGSNGNIKRIIPNFKYKIESDYDERTKKVIGTGSGNIYIIISCDIIGDLIKSLLEYKEEEIGYKITLTEDNNFLFEYYLGVDRSYNQIENPCVIFSNEFGNLYGATFKNSKKNYKNQAIVVTQNCSYYYNSTEVRAIPRMSIAIPYNSDTLPSGLELRELTVDGSNIQNSYSATNLNQWDAGARSEGFMQIGKHKIENTFEGEGENTPQWTYRKDYFLGDIVQIEDPYGNSGPARIVEYIFCDDDSNGEQRYPKFSMI